jgi:predicted XRE-type DNA-binding protein
MDKRKRAKLRAAGWTVGTPREFLRLSDEEAAFVEFKLALSKTLQALRTAQELSQVDVAKRLRSSQSRVAKMEASDPSVSVDLLVKSLFRLGAQPGDIAKAIRPRRKVPA